MEPAEPAADHIPSPESPTSASAARGKNGDAALKRQYEEGFRLLGALPNW